MARFDKSNRIAEIFVAYVGPMGSGCRTCQQHLLTQLRRGRRIMDPLLTRGLIKGDLRGFRIKTHGYAATPGGIERIRHLLDGVVFVADSTPGRLDEMAEGFDTLCQQIETGGIEPEYFPLVYLYNKRDLADALPLAELDATLNPWERDVYEGIATQGRGVIESFQKCLEYAVSVYY